MRKLFGIIVLALLVLSLWPSSAIPASLSNDDHSLRPSVGSPINLSQDSGASLHPGLATDPFGNLHIVWEDDTDVAGNFDIYYRRWNGSPWGLPSATRLLQNSGLSQNPKVAVDSAGKVHVVWEDDSTGNFEILYRSWDGSSWSPTENLSQDNGASYSPDIAVDGQGKVHVVWSDNNSGNYDIFYRRWDGFSWSSVENLSQDTGSSVSPKVAADPSGNVDVVWSDDTLGNYDILYRRYSGAAWSRVDNVSNNSGASTNPAVTLTSSSVHVVWQDDMDMPGSSQIFHAVKGGATWSAPENISQNISSSSGPDIVADSAGKIHVVWSDDTSGKNHILYRNWNGLFWSDPVDLSPDSNGAYSPAIARDSSDNIHVVWSDNISGNYEILYNAATPPPSLTPTPTPPPTAVPATNQIQLTAGWNLISVRSVLQDPSVAVVFAQVPAVTKAFFYQDGAWVYSFRQGSSWSGNLTEITDGKAYWIFATAPATLIIQPGGGGGAAYPLKAGWSMIGYTSSIATRAVDTYLESLAGKWTSLYRYDTTKGWELAKPSASGYPGFTDVGQGRGYWINLTDPGTLTPP